MNVAGSFVLLALLQQTLPVPPLPAIVQGRVIDAATQQPLARATVQLQGGFYTLERDTAVDGTFTFQNVPPGEYAIEVSHSGYITRGYPELQEPSHPTTQTLKPGQSLAGIQVALMPGAVISGRLVDDRGEVVVGATVAALKTTYREGRRQRVIVQTTQSNDLGEYRLFTLAPGDYVVSVSESVFAGRPGVQWYFPGTVDSDEAQTITLSAGEMRGDVSFPRVPTRGRKVGGTVQGANGGASVLLSSRTGDVQMSKSVNPDTGAFEFSGVSPGAYTLVARSTDQKAGFALDVGNTDILNARITLAPGLRIPVRVRIEGHGEGDDPELEKLYFSIRREPPISGLDNDLYSPFSDGHFAPELLPGDYRIDISRNEDMFVKSMRFGDLDVLGPGLRVSSSSDTPIEILIGTNPGSVAGRTSAKGATVVLVPDAARRGQRALYKVMQPGASGEFSFQKVPPGEYKLFAWLEDNGGPWLDAEYVKNYEEKGTLVRVEAGKKSMVDGAIEGLR